MALVKKAIALAQENQQYQCPLCRVRLDYSRSRQPNSPEADHIIPYAEGGQDVLENVRIICRRCNQSLGGRLGRAKQIGAAASYRTGSKVPVVTFPW